MSSPDPVIVIEGSGVHKFPGTKRGAYCGCMGLFN